MKKLKLKTMTINDVYRKGIDLLVSHDIPDADYDARVLLEFVLDVDSTKFFISRAEEITSDKEQYYSALLERRVGGEPLQYIIGKWEFMGDEFYVGEGVLIPRPETEGLIGLAADFLSEKKDPVVIDLCSGSGCIAISIAKLFPRAKVYAVEKYDEAFSYLERNISLNKVQNVVAVKGDIFDKDILNSVSADLILSNPPYIKNSDLRTLSKEVLSEPSTALDGGEDGYDYYRFLALYWLNEFLPEDSAMMVECGEDQGDYISGLFSTYANKTDIIYDFNGLQRIVTAFK